MRMDDGYLAVLPEGWLGPPTPVVVVGDSCTTYDLKATETRSMGDEWITRCI